MIQFDPASFKDPSGRVFYHDGWVGRTLSSEGRKSFETAQANGLIPTLIEDRLLVPTEIVRARDVGLDETETGQFILKQPRIALITYPYEWSFEMLRDAALVTLAAIKRALERGFILKDATSFNVVFNGRSPQLVDALSVEQHPEGTLWAGYGQFCRCFLFPLLVAAYRDLDMQTLLRGTLGELPVGQARRLLRARDLFRPGVFRDVVLQARFERSFAATPNEVRATAAAQPYPRALLLSNVNRLAGLVQGLPAPKSPSEWSSYDAHNSYTEEDRLAKAVFVDQVIRQGRFERIADLGCNTGEFAIIASDAGASVFAVDVDARAIDRLYRRPPSPTPITPVVADLLNPTPAMGWALRERSSIFERLRCDAFLALALVHHLRISGGVPLASVVDLLMSLAPEGIIEWVDKDDEMVRHMLSLRPDMFTDYSWSNFEAIVRARGDIVSAQATHGNRRRLCHVRWRAHANTL